MVERPAMREFFAPATLIAVLVMAVNDHWLKADFHNALTGKLSDFAGCFFLPLYVSALMGAVVPLRPRHRLGLGVLVTLGIFVPVSLSRDAADALCRLLAVLGAPLGLHGYRIAADPTDLMALPFVALAYAYGLKRTQTERA
ncbi:MAG: hypothetical protein AB2A00_25610 [Myxococcota bacterium]